MKISIKIIIITFIFFGTNNTIHAYRWIMNNFTSKTLLVQIELLHSTNPYFILLEPKHSADFDWSVGNTMAGFCLNKIKYVVADNYLLNQSDFINRQTMEVTNSRKLLNFLDKYADPKTAAAAGLPKPYIRQEANLMLVEDALFKQTVEEAKAVTGTKIGAKIVGYFADLVAESKCRGRDIMIVEKNGKIEFYTLAN